MYKLIYDSMTQTFFVLREISWDLNIYLCTDNREYAQPLNQLLSSEWGKKENFCIIVSAVKLSSKAIEDLPEIPSVFCFSSNSILHVLFFTGSTVAITFIPMFILMTHSH